MAALPKDEARIAPLSLNNRDKSISKRSVSRPLSSAVLPPHTLGSVAILGRALCGREARVPDEPAQN
jgi:hypothetical protein